MLEDELHFQLLRSFHFSNRAIVAQTSQLKLMPGQPKILLYLLEHDGAMAKEITEGCVLDKSTVTSLLARMAQQELIVRHPHARDRRAAMTYLTEKGRALAEEVHDICRRSDERALRGIDAQERQTLVRLLRQVSANLEEPV
ncbi:MAG: MarR family transcriptional regulator [Merdibacter sp.]|nr:MarR family transcriptional regulator [Merdibacter sp.]HIY90825.1 MarR family transcriptional regulator [Candidatus Merdibacter merdipullorum]